MPLSFEGKGKAIRQQAKQHEAQIEELYKQIGRLSTQNEWLKKKSGL
jgi:type VI protein secretion system component VasF